MLMGLVPKSLGLQQDPGTVLVGLRFLLGLCEACAYPTFARALANWMRHSERAMASGWRQSFLCSGAITLAVALWWWRKATDI